MKRISIRDEFDVDAERYWRDVFFSHPFQQRMYREALGCESIDILEEQGDLGSGITRKLRFVQRMEAPAPVRKIFGETTSLLEEGEFKPSTGRWTFRMTPDRMADKVEIRGETWLEPNGAGKVYRNVTLDVNVRIFAVGGLVEQFIASSTEERFATQTAFTRKYIAALAGA